MPSLGSGDRQALRLDHRQVAGHDDTQDDAEAQRDDEHAAFIHGAAVAFNFHKSLFPWTNQSWLRMTICACCMSSDVFLPKTVPEHFHARLITFPCPAETSVVA